MTTPHTLTRDAIDDMCDWLDTLSPAQVDDMLSEINAMFDQAFADVDAHIGAKDGHLNADNRKAQA